MTLSKELPVPIAGIAVRVCPDLPLTTQERITDTRAASVAESVMYREALATAGAARGWTVHWYDREQVFREATAALPGKDLDDFLQAMGRSIGPPGRRNTSWRPLRRWPPAADTPAACP
jgi:hypothetical protein